MQSLKEYSPRVAALIPILPWMGLLSKPGVPLSTMRRLLPRCWTPGSVWQRITPKSAMGALLMRVLPPLMV